MVTSRVPKQTNEVDEFWAPHLKHGLKMLECSFEIDHLQGDLSDELHERFQQIVRDLETALFGDNEDG